MKLIFAIVQNDDSKRLIRELVAKNISVTRIASSGGFLHGGNTTLMIGVKPERVDETLDIIKANSCTRKEFMVVGSSMPGYTDNSSMPIEVTIGGATVFIVDVEDFKRF